MFLVGLVTPPRRGHRVMEVQRSRVRLLERIQDAVKSCEHSIGAARAIRIPNDYDTTMLAIIYQSPVTEKNECGSPVILKTKSEALQDAARFFTCA